MCSKNYLWCINFYQKKIFFLDLFIQSLSSNKYLLSNFCVPGTELGETGFGLLVNNGMWLLSGWASLAMSVCPWVRSSTYDFLEQITVEQHKMASSYPIYICCCYWMKTHCWKEHINRVRRHKAPLWVWVSSSMNEMGIKLPASLIPQDHSENHKR